MQITLDHSDDVCVLRIHGRLETGAELEALRARADEIRSHPCAKVLADFSDVPFIGSTGIGFLVSIYTTVTKNGGGMFMLAGVNHRVREVLDLTCLSKVIPIASDAAAGMSMLRQKEGS